MNFQNVNPFIKKISKYIIVRSFGVAAYLGLLILFVEVFKINPVLSTAIATTLISAYLYLFSYVWVFNSKKNTHSYSLPRFLSIEMMTLFMNTVVMYFVVDVIGLGYVFGVIFGSIFIPLTSFLLNFFWAFNKK